MIQRVLALLILFWAIDSFAQQAILKFSHFATVDGLSNSFVNCLAQDNKGFLWIGTEDGLNKYDGYSFKQYLPDSQDSMAISSGVIRSFLLDSSNRLWIGTEMSLNLYDPRTDRFWEFLHRDVGARGGGISALAEDKAGGLWVATDGDGVYYLDLNKEKNCHFESEPDKNSLLSDAVKSLIVDSDDNVWIGTEVGLDFFNSVSGEFTHFQHDLKNRSLHASLSALCEDIDGKIWIGTSELGYHIFDRNENTFVEFNDSQHRREIKSIYLDRRDRLWMSTGDGLNLYDRKKDTFITYQHSDNDRFSLAENKIESIFQDDQGNLWLGHSNSGLSFAHIQKAFTHHGHIPGNPNSLSRNKVTAIMQDNQGNLWVGYRRSNIDVFDRRGNKKHYFVHDPGNKTSIGYGSIFALLQDSDGNIWIGTDADGLNLYNPRRQNFTRIVHDPTNSDSPMANNIRHIVEDGEGNLWLSVAGKGVDKFDRKQKKFTHYLGDPYSTHTLSSEWGCVPFITSSGEVWIGTLYGLNHLDKESGSFTRYFHHADNNGSLRSNRIFSLFEDSCHNLWVGTDAGLLLYHPETDDFSFVDEKAGLQNSIIKSILEDNNQNLWLATNKGLSRFSPEDNSVLNFGVDDGLQSDEFFQSSCFRDNSGKMYFGGAKGFNVFHPDSIATNLHATPVLITDLKLFNKSVPVGEDEHGRVLLTESIVNTEEIKLSYRDIVFTLNYVALNYEVSRGIQYAYRLQGFEDEWNYVGNLRSATYTSLPPGDYSFEVKAFINDQAWAESGTSLRIIVMPAWWTTKSFRLLIVFTGLGLLYFAHSLKVKTVSRRNKVLERRVQARTAALRLSNEELQQEIAVREKTEEAVVAERERLDVTLRSIGEGVITTDTDGRVLLVNRIAEQLTGWKQDEAVGKSISQVFRVVETETRNPRANPVQTVLSTGKIVGTTSQILLLSRDGAEHIIADSGAPIRDHHNHMIGVVLVFRNITDKIKVDLELQKANKLESVGVLAGGIAHDFNNILTAIFSNVTLAKLDLKPSDDIYNILADVEVACNRARDLTQQLLTFSKGGSPLKKTLQIESLIKESAVFALRGSNVLCSFSIKDDLWPVEADAGQISQVINNLIINADQAMPEGGTISVLAENVIVGDRSSPALPLKHGTYVKISIVDRGIGIPRMHFLKIFDPFFTTKQKGNGLGLATTYSIVKNHDGHIDLDSELGSGTTFCVYLPASENSKVLVETETNHQHHQNGRVLVMDDEEVIRKSINKMLTRMGYNVVLASDGKEAIELYEKGQNEKQPFKFVIMDLTVPGGMGGQEAIKELQRIDPEVKAIVSSGYSNSQIVSEYKNFGFIGVLSKPYDYSDLGQTLNGLYSKA